MPLNEFHDLCSSSFLAWICGNKKNKELRQRNPLESPTLKAENEMRKYYKKS
jgi:hypothetical protein